MRNLELQRKILLKIEKASNESEEWKEVAFDDYTIREVSYNLDLMGKADYIIMTLRSPVNGSRYVEGLTDKGCEYLNAMRCDEDLEKMKHKKANGEHDFSGDYVAGDKYSAGRDMKKVTTTKFSFYKKPGVIAGAVAGIITSVVSWGIMELIKFLLSC